ncbi:hypothetical protein GCM10025771_22980 [Niveibacterium umoris]|uniref:PilZ domain-containing protein n=1 Tax=Niveibacterium umoris TaxID=1193620 RepID=A0A840BIQ3_9RHOO|nr:hypothetical protein [Niveibacterium umoris]MBB4012513.1 hypothetical protein [Niveibacterium umoris]
MLKLFPSRPDHPLADLRELQRAVTEIGSKSPDDALKEATGWLETIGPIEEDSDPTALLRLLLSFDEAMQAHTRQLAERYVDSRLKWSAAASTRWRDTRYFLTLLGDRYAALLRTLESGRKPYVQFTADVAVRLLRAAHATQRWDALRYGPHDPQHWRRCGHAYLSALRQGFADQPVRLRSNRQTETSATREYLRTVALATAALDELDERQILLAGQVVNYVLASLRFTEKAESDSVFWVDPALPQAPMRMARPPTPTATVRYFSGGAALDTLIEMEQLVRGGTLPPALGVEHADAPHLAPLLRHLARHWSEEPPVRRHRRHPLPGAVQVIEGLEPFVELLSGQSSAQLSLWEQRDASLHGIGLTLPVDERSRLRIGALLGLHSNDGTRWLAGVVRRMQRVSDEAIHVGVEVLSWHPMSAHADDGAQHVRVLLLDPLQRDATIRLAVPVNGVRPGAPLFLLGQNKALKLLPRELIELGADHEVRSYQVAAS